MPFRKDCSGPNQRHITLHPGEGQRLVYTVKLLQGAAATFVIRDSRPADVLSSQNPHTAFVWTRTWPTEDGETPAGQKSISHVVSFTFVHAVKYQLQIERVDADGNRETVKDCTYEREAQTDSAFDKWTIQYA